MRKALALALFALCTAPVAAAESAHCDATPFTLGKPAATAPRPQSAEPKPKPPTAGLAAKKPQPKAQGKQRLLAACKGAAKKKKSG